MTAPQTISVPSGLVVCTTYGSIQAETAFWFLEMRSHAERAGLNNVEWQLIPGALVDKARNDAMRRMLGGPAQWLLMIDGDMVGPQDALIRILQTAYHTHRQFDVLGGYANLRGQLALPTIDTGTGTWESHYPGSGVLEVMRTGGAFLLVKRHVAERIPDPWFALRVPIRPLDAVAEVDNYCRTIFDGRNPFRGLPSQAWEQMEAAVLRDRSTRENPYIPSEVGEDSSFCDRVKAHGLRIAVDTDCVIHHLTRTVQTAADHKKAMDERDRQVRLASGLLA